MNFADIWNTNQENYYDVFNKRVLSDSSYFLSNMASTFLQLHFGTHNRGPAPFHRLTPNKRFEPVFSTVIMAVCSLFNRILLLTDLIPVHLLYCGQTVVIGCNHTSFEWIRAVRHIYGIIRHMQGLYRLSAWFTTINRCSSLCLADS